MRNNTKKPGKAMRRNTLRGEMIAMLVEIEALTAEYNSDRARIMRKNGLTERRRQLTVMRRELGDILALLRGEL